MRIYDENSGASKIGNRLVCIQQFLFSIAEYAGPAFEEFLNCIGDQVRLKGFEKYRAQLDNKSKCNY